MIPFAGHFRPFWQGLGTLAVDLLLVVSVVSLVRQRLGPRVFRAVHSATYLFWPIAMAHAIGNGTDRASGWMLALLLACAASVTGALVWRVSPSYAERGRNRIARRLPDQQPAPQRKVPV